MLTVCLLQPDLKQVARAAWAHASTYDAHTCVTQPGLGTSCFKHSTFKMA